MHRKDICCAGGLLAERCRYALKLRHFITDYCIWRTNAFQYHIERNVLVAKFVDVSLEGDVARVLLLVFLMADWIVQSSGP